MNDPLVIGALGGIILLLLAVVFLLIRNFTMSAALDAAVTRLTAIADKLPADVAAAVAAGGNDTAATDAVNAAAQKLEDLDATLQPPT